MQKDKIKYILEKPLISGIIIVVGGIGSGSTWKDAAGCEHGSEMDIIYYICKKTYQFKTLC